MWQSVTTKTAVYAALAVFVLTGCQAPYEFSSKPPLRKLRPAEIYDVDVDPKQNPVQTGEYYLKNKGYVQSVAYFEVALKGVPKNKTALLGVASSYSMLGQFKQADAYFQMFSETYGETAAYNNDFGFSQILRGNLDRAETLLLRAHSQAPNSVTIKNNLDAIQKLRTNKQAVAK